MSESIKTKPAPDAATVEAALIAACRHRRFDRSQAFASGAGSRGVRILAGAALKARIGGAATTIAPLFQLSPPELAPSMLARYSITTDDLLEVVEGLGAPEEASVPVAPVAAAGLAPGAPPPFQPRERKRARASAPKPVARSAPLVQTQARAVRLKPMTERIARWGRMFLASPIWTPEEVAELFDVHPDALIDAVSGPVAA